jgi:hypothetical protein
VLARFRDRAAALAARAKDGIAIAQASEAEMTKELRRLVPPIERPWPST